MIQNNDSPEPLYVPKPGKGCGWTIVVFIAAFVVGITMLAIWNGCGRQAKKATPKGFIAWKAGDSLRITVSRTGDTIHYAPVIIQTDEKPQADARKGEGKP